MSELEEAYKILQLKPHAPWEQVISQHKLLTVLWNPARFEEDKDQWSASSEVEKINWAKTYIESSSDRILRLESKSVCRIELSQTRKETDLKDNANSIYFPKTQNLIQGEQPLYIQTPILTNRWRVTDGSMKIWERYLNTRFFIADIC